MSYTNKTTHYELPQYVATDKPKYLTDFNETMATIDSQMYTNATAAATAQTTAEGAQSTADGAVSSIGTLNTQINGDPTDPSDTGLAGDVSALDGDVNTIQSLLGNGTPTTSNQTVIGAINAIEGAIAPAEDSATLGANYATGEQFARGGIVYEALTDLTSGTAFTSLTLNTDYKVADTLVKQISDKADVAVENFITNKRMLINAIGVTLTADGIKTVSELLDELYGIYNTVVSEATDKHYFVPSILFGSAIGATYQADDMARMKAGGSADTATLKFHSLYVDAANDALAINEIAFKSSSSTMKGVSAGTAVAGHDYSSNVPTSGDKIGFTYYEYAKI